MKIGAVGMPWYREEDYAEIKRLFVDGERLHANWADWLRAAEKGEATLTARGQRVIRVEVRPDEFQGWCRARSRRPDSAARGEFAADAAHRVITTEK